MTKPISYLWDGGVMHPFGPRQQRLADQQFVQGERYMLEEWQTRSDPEHARYFALLNEAWETMPELRNGRWASPDKMRKWALVEKGFCRTNNYPAATEKEARRFVSWQTREYGAQADEIKIWIEKAKTGKGWLVYWQEAESQNYKEMSAARFRASVKAVFAAVSEELGVDLEALLEEGEKYAPSGIQQENEA